MPTSTAAHQRCAFQEYGWLFASETLKAPIGSENLIARYMRPRLEQVGLRWVDYRVMRRTHSSLMRERGVDPKPRRQAVGHGVDVNLNVYTQTPLEARLKAFEELETALSGLNVADLRQNSSADTLNH